MNNWGENNWWVSFEHPRLMVEERLGPPVLSFAYFSVTPASVTVIVSDDLIAHPSKESGKWAILHRHQ